MCNIEEQMKHAAFNDQNWKSGNTQVKYEGFIIRVYLWGNLIAEVCNGIAHPVVDTLIEHPTVTTVSRLRALGVNVRQFNHDVYLDGQMIAA